MKILMINTSDHAGGAAIAAMRLLRALRKQGVEAKLLCRDSSLAEADRSDDVVYIKQSWLTKLRFLLERFEIFVRNGFSRKGLFSVDTARWGNDITGLKEFREADVIHLHWVNQAMLSFADVDKILRSGKRVVWTMHDMWPFTGVCHQAANCEKWRTECSRCPQLRKPAANDLSCRTFGRKRTLYGAHPGSITFVGCSQWLAGLAQQSPLLTGQTVTSIPNPIDTDFYAPAGTEGQPSLAEVRQRLGLPADKRLLLFTAFKVTDPNKGIDYLREALSILAEREPDIAKNLAIVLAGREAETLRNAFAIEATPMGYVASTERMRLLYQAADLLLMPTLMDNLPNTIMEAMACGTPCVAFSVGGTPQMVDTGINGYLAACRDSADFAEGIRRVLSSQSYTALCRNARAKAVKAYAESAVAEQYLKMYSAGQSSNRTT